MFIYPIACKKCFITDQKDYFLLKFIIIKGSFSENQTKRSVFENYQKSLLIVALHLFQFQRHLKTDTIFI